MEKFNPNLCMYKLQLYEGYTLEEMIDFFDYLTNNIFSDFCSSFL